MLSHTATRTPRCSCPATTPASPTLSRATRPLWTSPTLTHRPPAPPLRGAGRRHVRVRRHRPVQLRPGTSSWPRRRVGSLRDRPIDRPRQRVGLARSGRPSATPPTTTSTASRHGRTSRTGRSSATTTPPSQRPCPTTARLTPPGQSATVCSTDHDVTGGGETELTFTDTGGNRARAVGHPGGPRPQSSRTPRSCPGSPTPTLLPPSRRSGSPRSETTPPSPTPTRPTTSSVTGRPTAAPTSPPASPSCRLAPGPGCPSPPDQYLLQRLDRGPGAGRVQHPLHPDLTGGASAPQRRHDVLEPRRSRSPTS